MKEEYNYTLTVPLSDADEAASLMAEAQKSHPQMRLSRTPDTRKKARFYLSFPFSGTRTDLKFHEWISGEIKEGWDLYGPNYGIWGLS